MKLIICICSYIHIERQKWKLLGMKDAMIEMKNIFDRIDRLDIVEENMSIFEDIEINIM